MIQQATTAGVGRVYWDSGAGFSEKNSSSFAVAGSQNGSWRRYNAHLPAIEVQSLQNSPDSSTIKIKDQLL